LDAAEFGKETSELRWVPKTFERKADPDALDLSWLAPIARFVAESARVLFTVALAVGIAALLFALRGVRFSPQRDREPAPLPRTFLGLELDPASLPEDVAGSARQLWQAGDLVAALSLLYRGALVKLGARGALEIPASATEFECVRAVRSTQPEPVASAFGALTGSWIRTRYAHAPPTDGEFEGLCARFAQLDAPS